jgi:hypothetical protein
MSQVFDLCEAGSDDNGDWPNTALVPPLPLSRKRLRDKEVSSEHAHPRNENGSGNKTATGGWAEFVFDLELADDVEVSPHKNHWRMVGGKCSILTTERVKALEGSGFLGSLSRSSWDDRLRELADYRKIHGHCNVSNSCREDPKLANWVRTQRTQYKLHVEGKASHMTLSRIQELEIMGFEWGVCNASWEARLSELADYRKIHGHCNATKSHNNNSKLVHWVKNQRTQYRLHGEGKASSITLSRIQELESLGFEWGVCHASWEDRLSQLADYRIIHGHCNVSKSCIEDSKLYNWVDTQRTQYKLNLEGKASSITLSRIQELESMGFEWKPAIGPRQGKPKKANLDDVVMHACERVDSGLKQPHGVKKKPMDKASV